MHKNWLFRFVLFNDFHAMQCLNKEWHTQLTWGKTSLPSQPLSSSVEMKYFSRLLEIFRKTCNDVPKKHYQNSENTCEVPNTVEMTQDLSHWLITTPFILLRSLLWFPSFAIHCIHFNTLQYIYIYNSIYHNTFQYITTHLDTF